ncbi:MAG: GGDEF domain-containing protein [Kofleriaceae bacterium]|nr:GGDEF domain-containing protein [Myxococcales bacterium]MCB9572934.1 GGDEF domain-containing protein [Kofleriaceae bacterium]
MSENEGTLFITPPPKQEAPKGPGVLVFIAPPGPLLGKRFELKGAEMVVGRLEELPISCEAEGVSRRHAKLLTLADGSWAVEDLGSTNGTWVNDERITTKVLRDGDQVRFGSAIAKFLSGANVEATYHEEIYRMTVMDALTGVHNKRFFLEFLERELASAVRHHLPLTLVMFDIDHFKKVNDVHGHLAGDAVLREIGRRLRARVRADDLLARYGGEEFGVVLTKTALAGAMTFAEQLRATVADEPFTCSDTLRLPITISMGVAEVAPGATSTVDEFIKRADEHLYEAKHGGRNQVVGR